MITAIQEDWQMPKTHEPKSITSKKVATKFHNFEQRTDRYTAKELEDKVLNQVLNKRKALTNA